MKTSSYIFAGLIAGAVAVAGNFLWRGYADGLTIDALYRLAYEAGVDEILRTPINTRLLAARLLAAQRIANPNITPLT